MSIAVCLGFIIAWMPYAFICLWSAYGDADSIPNWLMPLPVMLAKSSIAYNPIIYIFLTDRYKLVLVEFRALIPFISIYISKVRIDILFDFLLASISFSFM